VEGLLHVSELDEERVEKPEDKLEVGEVHKMKIIKMSDAERKIGLSIRAVDMDMDTAGFQALSSGSGSPNATLADYASFSTPEPAASGEASRSRESKEEATDEDDGRQET
jgi:ribosomal protein S1